MTRFGVLSFAVAFRQWPLAAALVDGPWIGILGLPASEECDSVQDKKLTFRGDGGSCLTNLYDKWVQSAGARAVGIPFNALDSNQTALDELLDSIDGVIFTGGGLDLTKTGSPYFRTGRYIFDWIKAQNDNGVHFPLHGHCMGFQFLAILAAGSNSSVLLQNSFDSEGLSLPLEWAADASRSKWVLRMPEDVRSTYTNQASTTNLHHDGVTPSTFYENPALSQFFDVVSTNHDRKGKAFVSTMESSKYPILAVQWHPERNQFEWTPEANISHSADAVAANSWTARDFINEAWKHIRAKKRLPLMRRWDLLRAFATFSMSQAQAGDALDGVTYLMFDGFSPKRMSIPATSSDTTVIDDGIGVGGSSIFL